MDISEDEMMRIFDEVVKRFLIKRFDEMGMEASGEWKRNLEVKTSKNEAVIRGRKYTEQLVYGRSPGSMPPVSMIEKWVGNKFGLFGQQAKSASWAIATKIKNEGTTWYKKGGTDLIEVLEKPEVAEFIQNEIGKVLIIKVQNNLIRELKKLK